MQLYPGKWGDHEKARMAWEKDTGTSSDGSCSLTGSRFTATSCQLFPHICRVRSFILKSLTFWKRMLLQYSSLSCQKNGPFREVMLFSLLNRTSQRNQDALSVCPVEVNWFESPWSMTMVAFPTSMHLSKGMGWKRRRWQVCLATPIVFFLFIPGTQWALLVQ